MMRLCWTLLCLTVVIYSFSQTSHRTEISVNSSWKFYKGDLVDGAKESLPDEDWKVVNIPHTWNATDVLADGERGYYRGPAWYRKRITIAPDSTRRHYLYFEGANQEVSLYVNGIHAGNHAGGYTAFSFDITPYIRFGKLNIIAIRVDNTHNPMIPPLSADFTFFGGIYRDVFLISTQSIHFALDDFGSKGVYLKTPVVNDNQAQLQLRTLLTNETTSRKKVVVKLTLKDRLGKTIATQNKKITLTPGKNEVQMITQIIKGIELWSPSTPTLYITEVEIWENDKLLDQVRNDIGFRWFRFDSADGFFLNGKPLKLIGANRHQDYVGIGNALSDEQHRSDLKLLKEMGANFVRLAHYPQDPAVLKAADELGLLVWEETPLVNEITLDEQHHKNAEVMLREMIRQHFNHPSIILWGYMNEIYWAHRFLPAEKVEAHTRETVALAKRLEAIARSEDPSRYTAMAMHNYPLYETSGIDSICQVAGWNLYHGWYYDELDDFGKFVDRLHARNPKRPHIISEFGAGADLRVNTTQPEKFDFSPQFQNQFHEQYLKQILERPHIAGATVWNLIDFSSERRIDATPHINNKGIMTSDRKPKDSYFLYQAALRKKPVLKIAETSWTSRVSYAPAGKDIRYPVHVYSNLPEVELFHNQKSLGKISVENFKAVWQVSFSEGENKFEAVGKAEGNEVEDALTISSVSWPWNLKDGFNEISINAGSNVDFTDPFSGKVWVHDKAYESGSWGYVGGKPLYVANKIGSKEDILTADRDDPLYQTMRVEIEAYQFDVADGWYEVELLFVEPFPSSRRFVDGAESPTHEGGLRIFDVEINGEVIWKQLDLLKQFGYNYPMREKVKVHVVNGNGLHVKFNPVKGSAIVSGISVRQLK